MMWDYVMEHVRSLILLDPTLVAIFGDAYRKSGSTDLKIPSIEWTMLSDTQNELWAPMLVQFDLWTHTANDARRAERRIRGMFHSDVAIIFDTYTMQTEYTDGVELATPNRSNYTGRAVRFRFTPLRQQYARPSSATIDPS